MRLVEIKSEPFRNQYPQFGPGIPRLFNTLGRL